MILVLIFQKLTSFPKLSRALKRFPLKADPRIESFRSDPRLRDLMGRMNFPK